MSKNANIIAAGNALAAIVAESCASSGLLKGWAGKYKPVIGGDVEKFAAVWAVVETKLGDHYAKATVAVYKSRAKALLGFKKRARAGKPAVVFARAVNAALEKLSGDKLADILADCIAARKDANSAAAKAAKAA